MKNKLTPADITPAIRTAVDAVLLATAYARTKREQVDAIKREILTASVYLVNPEFREREQERITEPKSDWLMTEADFAEYHASLNQLCRQRGVKPETMPDTHCPALVAEHVQIEAERVLLQLFGEQIGEPDLEDSVHYVRDGWKQTVGLVCALVVNLPGYENPLTGERVCA